MSAPVQRQDPARDDARAPRTARTTAATDGWTVTLDAPLPDRLHTGDGTVMLIGGLLLGPGHLFDVTVELGGSVTPVVTHGMPRRDGVLLRTDLPEHEAYRGGFWAIVPVGAVRRPTVAPVRLRARSAQGGRLERTLGYVRLFPGAAATYRAARPEGRRHVVICMATFDPEPALFDGQIASLLAQTHEEWSCVISDDGSAPELLAHVRAAVAGDPRFRLLEHRERVGFYHNFERALMAAPPTADFVALADQDDVWAPEKLEVLLGRMEDDRVQLAFGDMRAVDREGRELAAGFWVDRRNNTDHLGRLLTSNTVTGAAMLFRRSLLDVALPFPGRLRLSFQDHWLAVCALTTGRIAFVDRVLQNYVQHEGQVLGQALPVESARRGVPSRLRAWGAALPERLAKLAGRRGLEERRRSWSRGEYAYALRTFSRQWLGTALLLRVHERRIRVPRSKRRMLRAAARGDVGTVGLAGTAGRALCELRSGNVTLGYHAEELCGAVWRRAVRARARARRPEDADIAMVHLSARVDPPPWPD